MLIDEEKNFYKTIGRVKLVVFIYLRIEGGNVNGCA